jgi:FAD/FMN-containing dehydrogenase
MTSITVTADGFFHPENEDQIRGLILHAVEHNLKVRVRGSAHSIKEAIYTNGDKTDNGINIMLDKMNRISIDMDTMQVTVQAGCHLGKDPFDPTGRSDLQNSLLYTLDRAGLAIPDLGGIIHQTVGGFLSTGSAGGSLSYSFGDQLIALRIIDGNGELHSVTRERGDDLFFAAGVSMGLLGIITEATFQCIPKFNIIGEETTTTIDDCSIDLFGTGTGDRPDLESFFRSTEYARLMWWPQKKVERMVVWKARQMKTDEQTPPGTGQSAGETKKFIPKPYLEFPLFYGTELPAEAAGGLFYTIVGNWYLGIKKLNPSLPLRTALTLIGWLYPTHILPHVIKAFVPLDPEKQPAGPQKFWDIWWQGLPMDNRVSDKLIPTEFTEIWIPVSRAHEVMTALRDHYASAGYSATGSYSCEIYAAKRSDFWLSPSYKEDVIRVDIFWFGYNAGSPVENYYPQFWKLLMEENTFPCRFHWGKYIPYAPEYLRKQYPKLDSFLSIRNRLDPNRVFLSHYWQRYLGIN